ncbi:MAG: helix-turn-helix transcriptional regulator [Agathobacter sp.]|nr:helix-turn-helix transcriptional regulator [Agathobacter sp.]MBQ2902635.1 helix-turn-helix transcriptional regulator [Agathobacter sp.]
MNNVDYIVSTETGDILIEKDSKRITDDIVDQLVAYRKKLKLTQQDIADATGMKRANIARIELKKNEAALDSLVRYARSMELDLSVELVSVQENMVREKIQYGNVYEEIKNLQPQDTLQLLLNAKTEDEKNFYELIGDFLLQVKQREVVGRNLF